MDGFIDLIRNNWHVVMFGGVTLGTLLTSIIAIIRFAINLKKTLGTNNALVKTTRELMDERKQLIAQREIDRVVIETNFKALSYLTAASKLSTADKLELQENFIEVQKVISQTAEKTLLNKLDEATAKAQEPLKVAEADPAFIKAAADAATTLIEKYTRDK